MVPEREGMKLCVNGKVYMQVVAISEDKSMNKTREMATEEWEKDQYIDQGRSAPACHCLETIPGNVLKVRLPSGSSILDNGYAGRPMHPSG